MKRPTDNILTAVTAVIIICAGAAFGAFAYVMNGETNVRYVGLQQITAEKMARNIKTMETNAQNVFNDVGKHLDNPEAVIAALKRNTSNAHDVRGYFAAFEPNFFKEKGTWFEPYVHHVDSSDAELSTLGSARHDYTRSTWYIRAKKEKKGFWTDPYFYYNGTDISEQYCTYVEPVTDANGKIACICGADITLSQLTNDLQKIDNLLKKDKQLNEFQMMRNMDYYSVVVDHDGSCLLYPAGKKLPIKDKEILDDIVLQKCGKADMTVDGVPSTLYYGPIEGIDWALVIVAPSHEIQKPTIIAALGMIAIVIIGTIIVWIICRRTRYAKK